MNLIKINLLPYREMEEQKKKKQFQTIMVIGAAAGLVAAGLIYSSLAGMILNQQGRNESLQAGIATLDKELEEIKTLNEQKRNFWNVVNVSQSWIISDLRVRELLIH
ncbi:PilN domain-containing protein [Kingella kingae]|uniref:PilN domain-containing protein n=1 Tax=Kingella kingae TaxID=504 RepID=UPI002549FF6B|nr:hypothetical protein [Kingella kingae]MDK4675805.1 hypothetical protein [Kingella kingae]